MSTENAVPEVRNLKQLLRYQEKAVVSRMLIKNPVGNVTLFAFDGNEGLSEHTAPYDALVIGVKAVLKFRWAALAIHWKRAIACCCRPISRTR